MLKETPAYQTADYMELLLRHLARDPVVFAKAQQFALTGDDFILSEEFGSSVYKAFADSILSTGKAPVGSELLGMLLKLKLESRELPETQSDSVAELWAYIYNGELNTVYFTDTLQEFVKHRRMVKARTESGEDLNALADRFAEIGVSLNRASGSMENAVSVNPFKTLLMPKVRHMTQSGFPELDIATGGLAPGEYAQVIGYSGGGKTALGCNIAMYNAKQGTSATYVSLEADEQEIANRFYANFFEINYTNLRNGTAKAELHAKFHDKSIATDEQEHRKSLADFLHLEGLKGEAPLSCNQIHDRLLRHYEASGHIPKVMVIDQLQFLLPNRPSKSQSGWEIEQAVAADVDELSHRPIGGIMPAVWLQHQAKGKLKKVFTREDINGFKGVIHKADLVVGIGREGQKSNVFTIFSIKVRHTADFELDYEGELQYMRFKSLANHSLAMPGYTVGPKPTIDPTTLKRDANAPTEQEPTYNGPKE